jgi:uncharacterized BrkB/YihY/UPF0761 family membrane protein
MNLATLHQKLIGAAKAAPPSDKVPYAFEKRILAHLRSAPLPDAWAEWAVSLWRSAVPCVLVMIALAGWALYTPQSAQVSNVAQASNALPDLSQQMENAVFAAAVQDPSTDSVW